MLFITSSYSSRTSFNASTCVFNTGPQSLPRGILNSLYFPLKSPSPAAYSHILAAPFSRSTGWRPSYAPNARLAFPAAVPSYTSIAGATFAPEAGLARNAVRKYPGSTMTHRMPKDATSYARVSVRVSTANFVAQ